MAGVVKGIGDYGNAFGVPTIGGEVRFADCYSRNPLVNAFTLGIMRQDQIFYGKASGVGNPVIYVGAKTGRDGIHGATMASEEFGDEADSKTAHRSGRRSVPGKAAARSLSRSDARRRNSRYSGYGRGGTHQLFFARWARARETASRSKSSSCLNAKRG